MPASAATFTPDLVLPSNLVVRLDPVGQFATAASNNNLASPVAIGDKLYVVDQKRAELSIQDGTTTRVVIGTSELPSGISATANLGIFNIAGNGGDTAYVGFTSSTLPAEFTNVHHLPQDDAYTLGGTALPNYDLIYRYAVAPDGSLSMPVALTAFETGISSPVGGAHFGGGMLVLPDGKLLLARGDNLNQLYDGMTYAQDEDTTVAKLLIIDGTTGSVEVAATGVRNVQRLTYTDASQTQIAFADIGRTVAEEINVVDVASLINTTEIENFGWGRNADGLAREGTFYINGGNYMGMTPAAVGIVPAPESGFISPYAQFGRPDSGLFAVSGPVLSDISFNVIDMLFGDLASGALFATVAKIGSLLNPVRSVGVADGLGGVTTLWDFLGVSKRDDLRFFNFVDGSAGLLLERSGLAFRITEVPLPASFLLLLGALMMGGAGLASGRRTVRT